METTKKESYKVGGMRGASVSNEILWWDKHI